jgi:hypothetical protein
MSETIAEWLMMEGEKKGQLRASRTSLRAVLEKRFGTLPETVLQRIEASTDLAGLQAALVQAVEMGRLEELQL